MARRRSARAQSRLASRTTGKPWWMPRSRATSATSPATSASAIRLRREPRLKNALRNEHHGPRLIGARGGIQKLNLRKGESDHEKTFDRYRGAPRIWHVHDRP